MMDEVEIEKAKRLYLNFIEKKKWLEQELKQIKHTMAMMEDSFSKEDWIIEKSSLPINKANNIQHTKSDGCSSLKKASNLIHPLKDGGHRNKSADFVHNTHSEVEDAT